MTLEDVQEQLKPKMGKRVLVVGKDHPHYNEIGETVKIEIAGGEIAILVKGEHGSFYVFSGRDLKFIN